MSVKPKVFIGSSSECLDIVSYCTTALGSVCSTVPWSVAPEFFESGSFTTFQALCDATLAYDFALFILSPDDELKSRGAEFKCPRDNVVFEMGLFIGELGPGRVFGIVQAADKLKMPSDLSGVGMPRFERVVGDDTATMSSVNTALQGFVRLVKKEGLRPISIDLAQGWKCKQDDRYFELKIASHKMLNHKKIIADYQIALVLRKKNPAVDFNDDTSVCFSDCRNMPDPIGDLVIRVGFDLLGQPKSGDSVDGRVVLVPRSMDLTKYTRFSEARDAGCRQVDSFACAVT